MQNNPHRRTALACTAIIVLGIILIFLPGLTGMDPYGAGIALSFFGGFIVIVGIISVVVFARLARLFDNIMQKENILVHWTYDSTQWKQYAEEEHREDKSDKVHLLLLVVVISIIAGIILCLIYPQDLLINIYIILGIIAVIGLTAYLSILFPYRWNKQHLGDAYIAKDGAYLNQRLHIWKGLGTRLISAKFEKGNDALPRIIFHYSSANLLTRNYYYARIPVPPGEEETARKIVDEIAACHLPKGKSPKKPEAGKI